MNRVDLFYRLLNLLKGSNREKKIKNMVDCIFDKFKTAPASSNTRYHCCYEGGLLDHSNIVTLKMISEMSYYKIPLFSVIITGLFHDLGKIGNKSCDFYAPAEEWKRTRGILYDIPDSMKILPHATRSIHILNQFDIKLNEHEFQAIMYHNLLPEERGQIRYNETPLLLLLHSSDVWSCFVYEKWYQQNEKIKTNLLNNLSKYER